jgi:DNA-binding transcriptional LysR family regulator
MDTRFIETFLIVAELGSVAKAAQRLGITAAAVSQRMTAFEKEIGAKLLARSGREMRPTEAGAAIIPGAMKVVRDCRELTGIAIGKIFVGEFRLGVISTATTSLLPAIIRDITAIYPEVKCLIFAANSVYLHQLVTEGALDAAIIVEPPFGVSKIENFLTLSEEKFCLIAPQNAPSRDAHELLASQPYIRYDRKHWGGRLADAYLKENKIAPQERVELDALEAIAMMVNMGLGVALVPDWAPPWPSGLTISKIALPGKVPVRRVGLFWSNISTRRRLIEAILASNNR